MTLFDIKEVGSNPTRYNDLFSFHTISGIWAENVDRSVSVLDLLSTRL